MAGGPQIVDAVLQGGDQVMVGSLTNSHTQALYGPRDHHGRRAPRLTGQRRW
jgi:hypothetical protein